MIRVLMVGYNGANNTGAEALLLSDIEDVRAVLGPEAHITVPTLNEANLRRYLAEGPGLRIAPMPTLFFGSIRRMVRESDLVLLVEGSTYMDTWGSPLLWAFLWATHCAAEMGKPCLAYAVDAGTLKPANARLVRPRGQPDRSDRHPQQRRGRAAARHRRDRSDPVDRGQRLHLPAPRDRPRVAGAGVAAGRGRCGGPGCCGLSPFSRRDAPLGTQGALLQVALLLLHVPAAPGRRRGSGAHLCGPGRPHRGAHGQGSGPDLHGAAR